MCVCVCVCVSAFMYQEVYFSALLRLNICNIHCALKLYYSIRFPILLNILFSLSMFR